MKPSFRNRFDDFFTDDAYVELKNLLYNYLLRKRAIRNCMRGRETGLVLEVGSGLSPMMNDREGVVFSELSYPALRTLKKGRKSAFFAAADAIHQPFKSGTFSWVVCSEVLEHLQDDRSALREMAAVMKQGGSLILTFPHRHCYFACDDRFVDHLRRYELAEMEARLREAGLNPVSIQKILGPLEKMTMILVISSITLLQRLRHGDNGAAYPAWMWKIIRPPFKWINYLFCLPIWLDARITPRFLSSVLLIRSVKL
ncbi:MAG: class I SAM-dependent methyltransferase [Syntrophales bacterium]